MLHQNAYIAFIRAITMFPYTLYDLTKDTDKMPTSSIFTLKNNYSQLATIIDRVTYIGLTELLIPAEQISFQHSFRSLDVIKDPQITGILVEQQVDSLERRGSRDSTQRNIRSLLESAMKVYSQEVSMPIRRARVMLRLLEVLYRTENVPALDEVQKISQEVETLLSLDVCNAKVSELVFELIFIREPRSGC